MASTESSPGVWNHRTILMLLLVVLLNGLSIAGAIAANISALHVTLAWLGGCILGGCIGKTRDVGSTPENVLFGILIGGASGPFVYCGFWMSVFARLLFG